MSKEKNLSVGQVILRIVGVVFVVQISVIVLLVVTMFFSANKPIEDYYYESTNIADYGQYVGNGNNSFPQEFIESFFPDKIQDCFSDVIYSYRAENFDTYGFEAYLEFAIHDKNDFDQYIASIAPEEEWNEFQFNSSYMEFVIADKITLHPREVDEKDNYIEQAKIGKILFSCTEQKIIYVALGVYDGGGVTTSYLGKFFERFNIDPVIYEQTAESTYGIDPYEVEN